MYVGCLVVADIFTKVLFFIPFKITFLIEVFQKEDVMNMLIQPAFVLSQF